MPLLLEALLMSVALHLGLALHSYRALHPGEDYLAVETTDTKTPRQRKQILHCQGTTASNVTAIVSRKGKLLVVAG